MSFGTRTWDEIVAQLITAFASQATDVTDLTEGSVITTMLEAVAVVAQQVEEDIAARLDADIETSAYRSFDFSLMGEQSATGTVQVFPTDAVHRAITLPVGTVFTVPGTSLRFTSQFETVLPENAPSVSIYVTADTPGTISNVPAGSVTQLSSGIAGIAATNNPYPFVNGKDAETEIERRIRFQQHIARLHYGTTSAIEAGLANTTTNDAYGVPIEHIGRVRIDESSSQLIVYITNDEVLNTNSANFPYAASNALISAAQDALEGTTINGVYTPGYKAAGVTTKVSAAKMYPLAVNLFVRPVTGYSMTLLLPAIQDAIQTVFNRLDIGETLSLQSLRRAILTTRGVDDFVLSLPSIDTVVDNDEIISLIPFEDVTENPPIANDTTRSWVQRL